MNKEILRALGFGKEVERAEAGKCSTCGEDILGFRDSLSIKEYHISKMCQKCQDEVFEDPEEDRE